LFGSAGRRWIHNRDHFRWHRQPPV
jgi:hypothetical protein